jgi:pimeloyl-ACP methyl ester carboxylesterase
VAPLTTFSNDGLTFDVADAGPPDGDLVVLLHGFPENKESWAAITPQLTAAGYRVLAPDQRGYSPGARPRRRRDYALPALAGDVLAMVEAAGRGRDGARFHVVGHDWGGGVAWALASGHPDRLASVTSLTTPHPSAMARSMVTSTQLLRSWYMLFYQLPGLPELSATSQPGGKTFVRTLVRSGLAEDRARDYLALLRSGAARPAINWYRAVPFGGRSMRSGPVTVPTLYVYAGDDFALGRAAADATGRYVTGPYRYEVVEGASHWLPEQSPEVIGPMLLEHLRAHPATT